VKTAQKIADCTGPKRKRDGVSHAEVVTQTVVVTPMLTRPARATTMAGDGAATTVPPDALCIGDCQSAKKIVDCQIQHQSENCQKLFSLVWQQCADSMRAKIKAHRDPQTTEHTLSGIELLRIIKLICFNAEDEKHVPQKVHATMRRPFVI
jgi:hypothetical protein